MIGIIFSFINEVIEVRIDKGNCLFRQRNKLGNAFVPIDGLQLNKNGVIKEHPDLKDQENWREEAIKRFKEHVKKMETEDQIMKYVINELSKCGYKPLYLQREGYRPQKIL